MGGGGGSFRQIKTPVSNAADLTTSAQLLAELRARQERQRRGVNSLVIPPTSTVPQDTGLRIPA